MLTNTHQPVRRTNVHKTNHWNIPTTAMVIVRVTASIASEPVGERAVNMGKAAYGARKLPTIQPMLVVNHHWFAQRACRRSTSQCRILTKIAISIPDRRESTLTVVAIAARPRFVPGLH